MEYARIYTALLTHPKWMVLSDGAQALIVRAWLFSALQETDGYVPEAARRLIAWKPKPAEELEAAGWWHRNGAGWDLHDWSDHQEAAADIKRRRELAKERKRRERERRSEEPRA